MTQRDMKVLYHVKVKMAEDLPWSAKSYDDRAVAMAVAIGAHKRGAFRITVTRRMSDGSWTVLNVPGVPSPRLYA